MNKKLYILSLFGQTYIITTYVLLFLIVIYCENEILKVVNTRLYCNKFSIIQTKKRE